MSWQKLADLPGQQVVNEEFPEIIYWSISNEVVLHQGRKLTKADAGSFEVWLPGYDGAVPATAQSPFVARDKACVYHAWSRLPKIDRNSCRHSGGSYWQDDAHVYCEHETSLQALKGADPASFKVFFEGDYAADAERVWYAGHLMKNAHAPSFSVLAADPLYAQDQAQVYHDGAALPRADPATWEYLQDGFSRDAKSVYFYERKLPRVDIKSWQPQVRSFSKDARQVYWMNRVIKGADPATWQHVHDTYSKDAQQVFEGNTALPSENPAQWDAQAAIAYEKKRAEESSKRLAAIFAMVNSNGED